MDIIYCMQPYFCVAALPLKTRLDEHRQKILTTRRMYKGCDWSLIHNFRLNSVLCLHPARERMRYVPTSDQHLRL